MAAEAARPSHLDREELDSRAKEIIGQLASQLESWTADGKDLQKLGEEDLSAMAPHAQELAGRSKTVRRTRFVLESKVLTKDGV